jgi:hypothetical protein
MAACSCYYLTLNATEKHIVLCEMRNGSAARGSGLHPKGFAAIYVLAR